MLKGEVKGVCDWQPCAFRSKMVGGGGWMAEILQNLRRTLDFHHGGTSLLKSSSSMVFPRGHYCNDHPRHVVGSLNCGRWTPADLTEAAIKESSHWSIYFSRNHSSKNGHKRAVNPYVHNPSNDHTL